jgi:hypothetical protein
MMAPQPGDRPSVEEIFGELEADDLLTVRGPTRTGRLRINMGRPASPAPDEEPGEEPGVEPGVEPDEELGEEPGEEPGVEPGVEPDEELGEEPGERGEDGASPSRVRINIRNKDEGAIGDSDR